MISTASPTYKLQDVELVSFEDSSKGIDEQKQKHDILITIKPFASNLTSDYLWSAQIKCLMIKMPIEKRPGYVTIPASSTLIDKIFQLFGKPHYRSETYGTNNCYYMDEDGTKGAK